MTAVPYSCPFCGHKADVEGPPAAEQVLVCGECQTVIAYGVTMPRFAVQAHPEDPRFVMMLIDSRDAHKPYRIQITIERSYGLAITEKLLAVCRSPQMAPGLAPDAQAATLPA